MPPRSASISVELKGSCATVVTHGINLGVACSEGLSSGTACHTPVKRTEIRVGFHNFVAEKRCKSNLSAHAYSNPASSLRSLNHAELKFRKRIARILTVASHTNRGRTQDTLIRNRHFRRGIILVKNCRLYIQYPGNLARTDCRMRNKFYLSSLTLTTKGRQSLPCGKTCPPDGPALLGSGSV